MNYLVAVNKLHLDLPGGAHKIAWDVACSMRDEGHNVAILCTGDGVKADNENCRGIQIVRYIQRPGINIARKVENRIGSASEAARKYLGHCKWDIIHAHSPFPGLGALNAFGADVRSIYTIHSPSVMEERINWISQGPSGWFKLVFGMGRLRKLESEVYNRFSVIQSLSNFTRSQVHRLYGVGEKVCVIPFWNTNSTGRQYPKSDARKKLGWPEKIPVLLSLRRMTSRMGLADAVTAAGRLAKTHDFKLVLAGDGPLREKLQRQAAKTGVQNKVIFTGRISDEEVALIYQAADLFLLPTRSLECFGIIILEAYSFGCPVLCSDCGAIPELVEPISPAFIFPAGNVDILTNKLADFLVGKLTAPSPQQLAEYVEKNYCRDKLFPLWRDMILGNS
jgi:glycosyltransferase involved in cell wall biosynthesis